ncbi:MAG: hypothetical protein CW694_00740 [Candidatus Syntrophoarchaeum sp. WYZ-LMO15]|nr:MAG: hypothetical protein CW694_00740 [Candidatus Syntrophoarchaeum sp. WYZ-LMO15]
MHLLSVLQPSQSSEMNLKGMSSDLLGKILNPASVAILGASARGDKRGFIILDNLIKGGYTGRIYPVNPNIDRIGALRVYPSLSSLPEVVDLAAVVLPADLVPEVIEEAVELGVPGAVITSVGVRKLPPHDGMRIIGPNSIGIYNARSKLNLTISTTIHGVTPKTGSGVVLLSQSGGVGVALVKEGLDTGSPVDLLIHTGDELDVDLLDVLCYAGTDPANRAILLYLEEIRRGREFIESIGRFKEGRFLAAVKIGRSRAGSAAAVSHTGAVAGDFRVYEGVFRSQGIIIARSSFDLLALARAHTLKKPDRIYILTNSGGMGIELADLLADEGVELRDDAVVDLGVIPLPLYPSVYRDAIERYSKVRDRVLFVVVTVGPALSSELVKTLIELKERWGREIVVLSVKTKDRDLERLLNEHGVPTYTRLEDAAGVIARLIKR